MNDIIVGNVCSLCAMVTDSVSGTRKKHSQILAVQILSQFFFCVSREIRCAFVQEVIKTRKGKDPT